MPTAPPGGENWNYTIPGILCQSLTKIRPAVAKIWPLNHTTWHLPSWHSSEGLFPSVMLFFDHIQPCCHQTLQIPQTQLLFWQQHSQNSWTSHWSHSWPHPLTGTPQSNMFCKSAVLQISGKLVHPSEYSSGNSPRSWTWCRTQLNSTGICAQFLGQHWPQEIWLLDADWHSWWDFKEEKASFSLHGLLVLYDGSCSVTMLQDLSTGRCLHLTQRVTRWTCWPSPYSCWLM